MKTIFIILLFILFFTGCSSLDKYGGNSSISFEEKGWFYTANTDKRSYFVSPEGNAYVAIGANHVSKFLQRPGSEKFIECHGNDIHSACKAMKEKMIDLNLNAGEAYSADFEEFRDMPYVANVKYPFGGKYEFDVFDKQTMNKFSLSFTEQAKKFADDKFILGITLIDLPIWDKRRVKYYKNLPDSASGKIAYTKAKSQGKTDNEFLALVAEEFYAMARASVKKGAPNHMFLGERYVLRMYPDEVLKVVGKYVDVFCTQALILSPQRPPEWQYFQEDVYDHEYALTKKPMLIIDWAAPFSVEDSYDHWNGFIKNEKEAAEDSSKWLIQAFEKPYIIGVFKCQLIGVHGNDKRFPEGTMKRTYLKDDGSEFQYRTEKTRDTHLEILNSIYNN